MSAKDYFFQILTNKAVFLRKYYHSTLILEQFYWFFKRMGFKILNAIGYQLLRWRKLILAVIWGILLIIEIIEHPIFLKKPNIFFFLEIGNFLLLIIIMGVFLDFLIRTIESKKLALSILDERHKLSLQLTAAHDWEETVSLILQYPTSIVPALATSLFRYETKQEKYIFLGNWTAPDAALNLPQKDFPTDVCEDCIRKKRARNVNLVNCSPITELSKEKTLCYCLHINYGNLIVGLLRIYLPQDKPMQPDQTKWLDNTAADIAIILITSWERKNRHEIEIANAASTERLEIARDLHDSLGQNLGYIHLKLDQILSGRVKQSRDQLLPELKRLRDLSNESYELVRNTLSILHQQSEHRLSELFNAHARLVAERAGFTIQVNERGQPKILTPRMVSQLFNLYKEALHNIEKHAHASQVDVQIVWDDTRLCIEIGDNGSGFDSQLPSRDGHFGLKMMEDRILKLSGQFNIKSEPGEGAQIACWIPLDSV